MADITDSVSRTPPKPSASGEAADIQERKEPERQPRDRDDHEGGRRTDSYRPDERRRSLSPRKDRPKRKDAGFKWKARSRDEDYDRRDHDGGLKRGYRDREDRYRDDRPSRDDRDGRRDRHRDSGRGGDEEHPRRGSRSPGSRRDRPDRNRDDRKSRPSKTDKAVLPLPPPPAVQQEMITVYVNDRLGTKKAIPCFATDRIKEFKIIVASMIGRQPHEILLKRQGERPFKDVLTLQDYGVSNNVQLDLEVDTGD